MLSLSGRVVLCQLCFQWESGRVFCLQFKMANASGRVEIDKFNGASFELWKLKMEDLLVDRDLWGAVIATAKPSGMRQEDWDLGDRKARGLIRLCLADSVLLNVHEEKTANLLWKKLGDIY